MEPSNENTLVLVPTKALEVRYTSLATPVSVPSFIVMHATDVLEAQDAVEHDWDETSEVGVGSTVRKLTPVTVTTPPPVSGALSRKPKLTTGAVAKQ